ncbi:MAG: glycosyltransferase family 4 protein [Firmicutes bacterium]|nr:glycosyltransferase family 4 protein [Bacillota bacterium]
MRVAVLTNEYEPDIVGGLGTVATRLAEAMAARGHDVVVVTKGHAKQIEDSERSGVRVIRFPRESDYHSKRSQVFYAEPILQYLESHVDKLDVLHIHSLQADHLLTAMRKAYDARTVYTCHSLIASEGLQSSASRQMERRQYEIMRAVDLIVAPSHWEKRMIGETYAKVTSPVRVIPNGVVQGSQGSRHREPKILYAGRIIRSKGIEELVRALPLVRRKKPHIELDLQGAGSLRFTREMQALSAKLHVERAVHLLGKCDYHSLQRRMARYSAVVVPSRTESFGLVALEAMAAGTPLISTRAGGLRDFVDPKVASIIANRTPQAIAKAILESLNDTEMTERRRRRAYERARDYTWSRISARYIDALEELTRL